MVWTFADHFFIKIHEESSQLSFNFMSRTTGDDERGNARKRDG